MKEEDARQAYDLVFNSRQRGDYQELVVFSPAETEELVSQSEGFVKVMASCLDDG